MRTKIKQACANNRRKAFEIRAGGAAYPFPYAKAVPRPSSADPVVSVEIDRELASEAISFVLASGEKGVVHIEQFLEYNRDPSFVRKQLLFELTIAAQRGVDRSVLSTREVIRRLGTSASQFYRLIDQTNYRKSIDQMLALLYVLDYDVDIVVRKKTA